MFPCIAQGPLPMICGCTQRSGSASFRSRLPGTAPDAKERRSRPAGAGNGAGNLREAAPGLTVIFVAFCQDRDFVQLSLPFAHDTRAGLHSDIRRTTAGGLAQRNLTKPLYHCCLQTSKGSLLQAISEDRNQIFPPQSRARRFTEEFRPQGLEILAAHPRQTFQLVIDRCTQSGLLEKADLILFLRVHCRSAWANSQANSCFSY